MLSSLFSLQGYIITLFKVLYFMIRACSRVEHNVVVQPIEVSREITMIY